MMRLILVVCLLCISFILPAQNKQELPSSLLWRITGNSIKGSSYLFGTMHLQDKRLFHFTDSLYASIRAVDGFAGELDMGDMNGMVSEWIKDKSAEENGLLLKDMVSPELRKRYKLPLEKRFKKKFEQIGYHEVSAAADNWTNVFRKQDDMPTFVDAFLFGLARQDGKWTGALEKMEDQLESMPENLEDKIKSALLSDNERKTMMDRFVSIYLSENLSRMNEVVLKASGDQGTLKMNTRNLNMVQKIDSISGIRTCFYAVGAAHLPGDSGMIQLLRNKGFKVEPVVSSNRVAPDTVLRPAPIQQWKEVVWANGDFAIKMPGNASVSEQMGPFRQASLFFDAISMSGYLSGFIAVDNRTESEIDSICTQLPANYAREGNKLSDSVWQINGRKGYQVEAETKDGIINMMAHPVPGGVVLNMIFSMSQAGMKLNRAGDFFSSFVVHKKPLPPPVKGWRRKLNALRQVSFEAPIDLEYSITTTDSTWLRESFTGLDPESQIYYSIIIMENRKGYYSSMDSLFFDGVINEYKSKNIYKVKNYYHTQLEGFPSLSVLLGTKVGNDSVNYRLSVTNRGNRRYSVMAGYMPGEKTEADAHRFMNGVRFIPYSSRTTVEGHPKYHNFYVQSPQIFVQDTSDSISEGEYSFQMFDSTSAVTAQVQKEALNKYLFAKDDSSFYRSQIDYFRTETDSLFQFELANINGQPAADGWISLRGTHNIKRVRLLASGDTLYSLSCIMSPEVAKTTAYQQLFTSFRIIDRTPNTYTKTKARELFNDLLLPDSLLFNEAKDAISWVEIADDDLPFLRQAILHPMIDFSDRANCAHDLLMDQLIGRDDPSTLAFVLENYPALHLRESVLQYPMLALLARMQTAESYEAIAKLLKLGLPETGHAGLLCDAMSDSLDLAMKLFPLITEHKDDSLVRIILPRLLSELQTADKIEAASLEQFRPSLLSLSDIYLQEQLNKELPLPVYFSFLLKLLTDFGDADSKQRLDSFALHKNEDIQYNTIRYQLQQKIHPIEKAVQQLAADPFYRVSIWELLEEAGKTKLFPAALRKQQYMGESHLFRDIWQNFRDFDIQFLKELSISKGRKKSRYYLYKVSFKTEEGQEEYLGVAGPYPGKSKINATPGEYTGVYYEEEFDATQLRKQLEAFIQSQQ